jgi:hypothetical protein
MRHEYLNEANRIEQRVKVKYLFLKGHASKLIHMEQVSTFQDNAISLSIIKNWFMKFKFGELSCSDEESPGRLLIFLDRLFSAF